MKRLVLALGFTALLVTLMGTLEPAEARVRWNVGADFSVGGVYFSLGFNDFDHYDHGPRYFYRTRNAFNYRGYSCGSACYLNDGYSYHHRDCPLLRHHFYRNGFNPAYHAGFFNSGYGYGPWSHRYRYDRRYDRRHRYRYDRRHDYRRDYRRDHRRDHRYDQRRDRRDRYRDHDRNGDSDSGRRDRYDRRDRDRRRDQNYDRSSGRRDDRRGKGSANRTRSRRRDN